VTRSFAIALLVLAVVSSAGPCFAAEPAFDAHWRDGKAELDGYRLTVVRYGHARHGRAVAIFVTEPFSRSRHVKLDDPAKAPADLLDVLKLNLVRDFQTGIYNYHTILSLFVDTRDFAPVKVAFSSSEWCGQVYEEVNIHGATLTQRVASYFEGESSERTMTMPKGGVQEDNLLVLLRGLRAPFLEPGGKRAVPFMASAFYRRLAHRTAAWSEARIERLAHPETVTVPAGTFGVDVYLVHPADGRQGRFDVERAYPHRIVRWQWQAAPAVGPLGGTDSAELTGSTRLPYWRTHDPGDEQLLRKLGMEPPSLEGPSVPR
jgi:hypothetical protein